MWYVMQVHTGKEQAVINLCKKQLPETLLKGCFQPMSERKKRFEGKWNLIQEVLFPGYVFVITEHIVEVHYALKQVPKFTKLLGNWSNGEFIPLTEDEKIFLSTLLDPDYLLKMSEGYIEGDQVFVTSGPLQGREGWLKKIDRHKRKAIIEVEMFGRIMDIDLGLEIVRKSG